MVPTPPISVDWHAEYDHIVVMRFAEPEQLSSHSFYEAVQRAQALIASRDKIVHLFIYPPSTRPNTSLIARLGKIFRGQPRNTGEVVVIIPRGSGEWVLNFMSQLASMMANLLPYHSPLQFTDSEMNALNIIAQHNRQAGHS